MGKVALDLTININGSAEDIFNLMTDVEKTPDIFSTIKRVENFHGGDVSVGDEWDAVSSFMGIEFTTHFRMAELQAPNLIVFESESNIEKSTWQWTLTEGSGSTELRLQSEGNTKGPLGGLAAPLVQSTAKSTFQGDMENVKAIIEG